MSLRDRLTALTQDQEAKGVLLGSCCLNPASHGISCSEDYALKVKENGHPFSEAQVEAALVAIPQIWKKSLTFLRDQSSYGAKHVLEDWWRRHRSDSDDASRGYISNGNFIAAMILLGFEWRVAKPSRCNAYFKMQYAKSKRERDRSRSPARFK